MRLAGAIALICAMAFSANAADEEFPDISSVLARATAMELIGERLLLIATEDGGYVCEVEVNPSYIRWLINEIRPSESVIPEAFCFSAKRIENKAKASR